MPLHPLFVHLPLALAFVLPFLALGVLVAWGRDALPRRAFILVAVLQALLVLGGVGAARTGELDAEVVGTRVDRAAIEAHESAADLFVFVNLVVLLGTIVVVRLPDERRARQIGYGLTLVLFIGAGLAFRAGQLGGSIAYELGGAAAFADPAKTSDPSDE